MEVDFVLQEQIEISLSVFDLIMGPRFLAAIPWANSRNKNRFVAEFFDFHQPGDFFTHIFDHYLSFNFMFEIQDREILRGGTRMLMLTASVPFSLLKKKDLLQYYNSLTELFRTWVLDLQAMNGLAPLIQDGRYQSEVQIQPLLHKLCTFLGEMQFIISVMPETVPIRVDTFKRQ